MNHGDGSIKIVILIRCHSSTGAVGEKISCKEGHFCPVQVKVDTVMGNV